MKKVPFLLFAAACFFPVSPAASEEVPFCYADTSLISFLKKDDSIAELEREFYPGITLQVPGYSLGIRLGLLYPGASREMGNVLTGPAAGGYMHMDMWGGLLECILDIATLKNPSETGRSHTLLFKEEVNYLYCFSGPFFAGGGLSIANATLLNKMVIVQAKAGYSLSDRYDLAFTLYFPLGPARNKAMAGLSVGYRF